MVWVWCQSMLCGSKWLLLSTLGYFEQPSLLPLCRIMERNELRFPSIGGKVKYISKQSWGRPRNRTCAGHQAIAQTWWTEQEGPLKNIRAMPKTALRAHKWTLTPIATDAAPICSMLHHLFHSTDFYVPNAQALALAWEARGQQNPPAND